MPRVEMQWTCVSGVPVFPIDDFQYVRALFESNSALKSIIKMRHNFGWQHTLTDQHTATMLIEH
jgi:hypothetical protein